MPTPTQLQYLRIRASQLGLDPEAVFAIDAHEGIGGGIGDGGHAFGPGQMNNAGGVLTGKFKGKSPQQINEWAWSPAGMDYYLNGVAGVARGLKGRAAIEAIASRYERPADIPAEISDALAHYGKMGAGSVGTNGSAGSVGASGASPNVGGSQTRQALAAMLLGGGGRVDFGSNQVQVPQLMQMAMLRQQLTQGAGPATPPRPSAGHPVAPAASGVQFVGSTSGVDAGFLTKLSTAAKAAGITHIRISSGFRDPSHNAAVGGVTHSNHTMGHALDGEGYVPGKGWVPLGKALLPVVGKFGLRSGDVPGFYRGGTDPVHVDDGWNLSH